MWEEMFNYHFAQLSIHFFVCTIVSLLQICFLFNTQVVSQTCLRTKKSDRIRYRAFANKMEGISVKSQRGSI